MRETHHWLLTEIQEKDDPTSIYICNVYGTTHYKYKVTFLEDLSRLKEDLRGKHLIIVGDFNTTKSQLEKHGGTKVKDPFGEKMEDLISDMDLLDIPLKNGKYTWSNIRPGVGHIVA